MRTNTNFILFSFDFPPNSGGIARLCGAISKGMGTFFKRGFVFANTTFSFQENNMELVQLPKKRLVKEWFSFIQLLKIPNKKNTIILCGLWHPEVLIAWLAGFRNIFVLVHGAEIKTTNSSIRNKIWLKGYAKFMLSNTKGIIANSAYTAELVRQLKTLTNIYTLPLGVDIDKFVPSTKERYPNKGLRLLTVARFEAFKGHQEVLEILSALPLEIQESITWNVVGNGKYREAFMQKVLKMEPKFQINCIGFVPESELPKVYQSADVFILCTQEKAGIHHVEGFGLVFLEAQASGLPVISKPTGGIGSAVEHLNGAWLFKENQEIVEWLVHLHHHPEKITKMGALARKRVENHFSWEKYCFNLNKILKH